MKVTIPCFENVCSYVTLIGRWQSKHPKPHQSELPSIHRMAFAKQTMAACRCIFYCPPPPYFDASTSPLESVFDLIQLLVSLNVQIDSTVKYVCFAGLDLRSGNTLTINKFEKWCFELMSGLRCDNVTFNGTILKTNGCHSFLKPT